MKPIAEAWRKFTSNLVGITILQIPNLITEIPKYYPLEQLAEGGLFQRYAVAIIFFWVELFISSFTIAATYLFLEHQLSVTDAMKRAGARLPALALLSLCLSPLGAMAGDLILLPLILVLLTLYLFAPLVLIQDRSASVMVVFNRSWRYTRRGFGMLFLLVFLSNVIALAELFGTSRLYFTAGSDGMKVAVVLGSALFNLLMEGLVASIVACYFSHLSRD